MRYDERRLGARPVAAVRSRTPLGGYRVSGYDWWWNPVRRGGGVVLLWSLFLMALLAIQYLRGVQISVDTTTYADGSFLLSPLSPLLLDIARWTAGSHWQAIVHGGQFLLGAAAVYVLSAYLGSRFQLPVWVFCAASYLLLRPYINGEGRIGNVILAAGIAYPLVLFATRWMLHAITTKERRFFFIVLGFVRALVLTREQFVFLYPVTAVTLRYLRLRLRYYRLALPLAVAFGARAARAVFCFRRLSGYRLSPGCRIASLGWDTP